MGFSKLFSYKSVDMPNKSGHDEFHRRYFSGDVGTLTPSFVDFLIPGDTVDLSGKFEIQLPPMATDFYGRINLRTELFYVPCRILFGGWKDFITYPSEGIEGPAPDDPNYHAKYLPGANVGSEIFTASRRFTTDGGISNVLFVPNKGVAVPVGQVNSDLSVSIDFNAYLTWYASARESVDDGTNTQAVICAAVRDSFLGIAVDNFIDSLATAIENRDLDLFWPDRPSLFSLDAGPGSLLDHLGFKVKLLNQSITDDYLLSVMQTIHDRLVSIYNDDSFGSGENSLVDVFSILATTGDYNDESLQILQLTDDSDADSFNYLALSPIVTGNTANIKINNILPLVCYHKIFDDWYRDPRIMKPLFPSALRSYGADTFLENIAYIPKFSGGFNKKYYSGDQLKFYDGKSLFDLRQRLWQKDYFTTMTAQPQAGDSMKVSFDVENASGEFTIAALRVANSMQQWLERNNLVSPRYGDVQYAQYGVYPSDAITDRSIYLGSQTIEVYNKAVYQQGSFDGNGANPFDSIGAKYGAPIAMDSGSFCNNYMVKEHGFLMALTSLVPEASYGSGTRRFWHYDTIADIAFPLLQGVGDQEVYAREIIDNYNGEGDKTVIGYQERYIEYKFIEDSVHGRLRDGQNLSSFMLQRTFSEPPELGADFLEIPKDYLNQVGAVNADVSDYGYWGAVAWDYRKVSSLSSANATPTLGRMVDVHTITVPKGGTRL